jgi:hypothetical protein
MPYVHRAAKLPGSGKTRVANPTVGETWSWALEQTQISAKMQCKGPFAQNWQKCACALM